MQPGRILDGMKQIRSILVIAIALVIPVIQGSAAAAASYSVSREIHVTARVLPKRTVIIDHAGHITEIASNTEEDVKPDVYLVTPSKANKRPLTEAVYKEYLRHVPKGTAKAGILYRQSDPVTARLSFANRQIFSSYITR